MHATHKLVEVENKDPVPYGCTYMVKKHVLMPIIIDDESEDETTFRLYEENSLVSSDL
jgi:hypothetical protein